jgi:IQ calmodulin-binding motif
MLAKIELHILRQNKAARIIQRWARVCLAKAELKYLRAIDIHLRKRKLAVKMQCLWRRKKAIRTAALLRRLKSCVIVQKVMRGY